MSGSANAVALTEVSSIGVKISNALVLILFEALAFGTSLVHQQFADWLTATRRIFAAVLAVLVSVYVGTV